MKRISVIWFLLCVIELLCALDLTNTDDYLSTFLKTRGDLSGNEVVYYWSGTVYSFIPGEKDKALFQFEGYNVARLNKTDAGYELLTREMSVFEDVKTGEILQSWENPWLKKNISVVQIWNDPVNQDFSFPKEYMPMITKILSGTDLGSSFCFSMDILLNYPSPLTRKDYPLYSQSDTYEAAELFNFFVDKNDIANNQLSSLPVTITWTRVSPWMPFMQMADHVGNLIFQCRGKKLDNGYPDLPSRIRTYVEKENPLFINAPKEWSEPNATSWNVFKKYIDSKK